MEQKKLVLNKETLRSLDRGAIREVWGGVLTVVFVPHELTHGCDYTVITCHACGQTY